MTDHPIIDHDGGAKPRGLRDAEIVRLYRRDGSCGDVLPAGMVPWHHAGGGSDVLQWQRAGRRGHPAGNDARNRSS